MGCDPGNLSKRDFGVCVNDYGEGMNREQPNALGRLTTEAHNPESSQIDSLSAIEIVNLMNSQDAAIADAIAQQKQQIAVAIERIAEQFRLGGRLIYVGAGTSGRLGVLDASECPPTFSTPPEMVVGLIAGGEKALTRAIEGAEDHPEYGRRDLSEIGLCEKDILVGIATSGRTPYVIGALQYARELGVTTIGFSCNRDCQLKPHSDVIIAPIVGPEVISGSTRLKAGTATKMVLNMLTTGAMVRIGKTYGNLMVDLRATNSKLTLRSRRILSEIAGVEPDVAERLLQQCGGELKTAIVAHVRGVSAEKARQLIDTADGQLRRALESPE